MNKVVKNLGLYLVLVLVVVSMVNSFLTPEEVQKQYDEISYSEFLKELDAGKIKILQIRNNTVPGESSSAVIQGELADGQRFLTYGLDVSGLADKAAAKGVTVTIEAPQRNSWVMTLLTSLFPTLLLIGVWVYFMNSMQGGGGPSRLMSFGRSKAKLFLDNKPKIKFDAVAGCDEAKEELQEVIHFLKDPEKFKKLGAKVPKGVLLVGPPGTGKTLLARAAAGEADVPFFCTSGSEFVEMLVGVGAARVRDLFAQAKKYQPCIIFIDEIDAVGRHRGAGLGGGHDEREQTLNQILVELDGFDDNSNTVLIAATNRPDILDPALLRPGRFDRHIVVDRPDVKGREEILKVHMKEKQFADDVDISVLARSTPGLVGADIENLVNEGALLAARKDKEKITMEDLEEGIERVMAGPERKSRIISEHEKKIIAYHETGHAIVAKILPGADPVHKISIIPRGHAALGYTLQLPEEDRFLISKSELMNRISILLSGRVSEEIVFNDVTSGAANDLEKATETARQMVTQLGMSDALGLVKLGKKREEIFLGRDISEDRNYSEEVAYAIDKEVKKIIDDCYERSKEILTEHRAMLDKIAEVLLEREVLDAEEFNKLIESEKEKENPPELPENRIDNIPNAGHDFLA
ncbi:MAG: ATP-dependent zinc metalloprotease FtsH [Synergistales bacterium]|nr:ATP-dependent zinc metalloprotease FtsH [Synergistales bacterium]MDY6400866.1 ATP-dependent zinc metalloprotease FtsH [Synergistales bacterium]MDY6404859.1 ATP-dependent zinc metalloprotease FtsH [Synergistales bacterium]MDY6410747.1 ATP-dependent zinc metalloprotease FtsH [Synergistales bacterium]MDY6414659.1 ATP-dependent zinc metalloprotease FtsH [Synergistales bacterium]